ncbi:MAG: transposase family protein, partial [Fuerstiella sp.]|nr:transposase family protein [Fuerstiella sp.]
MSENCRTQKQYDHRLRLLIQNTRDLDLAVRHGVPRSTARGWLRQSRTDVVSMPSETWSPAMSTVTCQQEHWLSRVFASPTTWYRLVRAHKWRRPRQRVHPAKPTIGIRATRANEIWHVDTTLIRLLDGSKAYLHAVIDNFSRRVLAWRVNDSFIPAVTAELLIEEGREIEDGKPQRLVDGGVENDNNAVDKLVDSGVLKRILAQTEIRYSNSLIESWWRVIK